MLGVTPVQPVGRGVQRETVRPSKVGRNDGLDIRAIHVRPQDRWCGSPIRPIHGPIFRMYDNGARRVDFVLDDSGAGKAVKGADEDSFAEGVRDVKVTCDPIKREIFKERVFRSEEGFEASAVEETGVDGRFLRRNVCPENASLIAVELHTNGLAFGRMDLEVAVGTEPDTTHLLRVREEEKWLGVTSSAE